MRPLDRFAPRVRRRAVVSAAAGCLTLFAGCSTGTQPADAGADGGGTAAKTIVFSPLALRIPAMKGLSEGVQGYGSEKGYEVLVQDPNLDSQKQVADLRSVIESGRVAGAWVISVEPSALSDLVKRAQEKQVALILNGTPEEYGLDGAQPLVSYSTIDYTAQGKAIGEELGNCINERLDGKATVLFEENAPGTAGKQELETAAKQALGETAPGAEIVATVVAAERATVQTDIGNVLQGKPGINAVLGNNDEGALGAVGAFAAAGKELPCITEAGGNDEVLQAVEDGKIYASVALQFQEDMVQSFDILTKMMADPAMEGEQLTVPQKVVKAGS